MNASPSLQKFPTRFSLRLSKCKVNYALPFYNKDNKNSFPRKRGQEEVKAGMKVEDNTF